ncbi:pyridoxal phosphate-dependent decarboxylase family protein [Novosphingobium sp.]|uniref:pyridoxal phosphate-dependent decarboxylase family protein n=1 Tax=Novosphingobium sp. TaxID=1874826 RepID=UPI003BAC0817
MIELPETFPETGIGEEAVLDLLGAAAMTRAADLAAPDALAHMDPPSAPVAARMAYFVAQANQNMLHPATSPFATLAEARVLEWIAPAFGMAWGQICSGSTLANLTALWAAREAGARMVVASAEAHISVPKAARILGLEYHPVPVGDDGRLIRAGLPDLADAALVLTAGTTGRGVIDDLTSVPARWLHVDAAWAGPLQLTSYRDRLAGIEAADSIAISAHKWFFQPKGAALALFRSEAARASITFTSSYLARPNSGVEGTRSAAALPLLATLLAWGREGLAQRIERCMTITEELAQRLDADPRTVLKHWPESGVLNWRPLEGDAAAVIAALDGTSSAFTIGETVWVRQVAANPHADVDAIWARICAALG